MTYYQLFSCKAYKKIILLGGPSKTQIYRGFQSLCCLLPWKTAILPQPELCEFRNP